MLDKNYFETPPSGEPGRYGRWVGGFGNWILHIAKISFLIYSGYHGISASLSYAGSSEIAKAAQVFGIVVLEFVLFGLYLAWHNQQITGVPQSVAAGATYAIGFVLACLGIVGDSQLHAVGTAAPWLVSYLTWGLPVAPAVMALGALLTHELAPHQLRSRKWQEEHRQLEELQFQGWVASQQADRQLAIQLKNMQLNAQATAVKHALDWYNGPEAQAAIKAAASKNAPALLASALGIDSSSVQPSAALPPASVDAPSFARPVQPRNRRLKLREKPVVLTPVGLLRKLKKEFANDPTVQPLADAPPPALPQGYTLCRIVGDHADATDFGSLEKMRESMAKRKAHAPDERFYIVRADTFEYVEGDLINGMLPQTKAKVDETFFGRRKQISPSDLSNPPWQASAPNFAFWAEGEARRLGVDVQAVTDAWRQHGASQMFADDEGEQGNGVNHSPLVS